MRMDRRRRGDIQVEWSIEEAVMTTRDYMARAGLSGVGGGWPTMAAAACLIRDCRVPGDLSPSTRGMRILGAA